MDETFARRDLLKAGAGAATLAGLSALHLGALANRAEAEEVSEVDYVIIGSGPGGAPLAANLAEAGYEVLVLEAGPPHGNTLFYDVPAFSNFAAGSDDMIRWDYWIQHYSDMNLNQADSKWMDGRGVLYPRASTLGGCSAHNALITMYPDPSDWAYIQNVTKDDTWAPARMWRHWEEGVLGWQPVEFPPFIEATAVLPLVGRLVRAAQGEAASLPGAVNDPRGANSRRNVESSAPGWFHTPQMSKLGKRHGPRERLLAAQKDNSGRLHIQTDALAERIVLQPDSGGRMRATAVEYLAGRHLFGASPKFKATTVAERKDLRRTVRARREVIVAAGAFGSPQLLMLSGIGPKEELGRHHIPVKVDLPGVGRNLQDRYEVSVISRHELIGDGARSAGGHRFTNGVLGGIKRRYGNDRRNQLFIFTSLTDFHGYQPGFHKAWESIDRYSWLILKGHAASRAGSVRLRSADPTQPPVINFRYFDDNTKPGNDMAALIDAVEMVRRINKRAAGGHEVWPGKQLVGGALEAFIRRETWGHHASCTNPIGPESDRLAVLDSKFRVHGTTNVRVVDASSFPRIPGLFLWAPTAILSEKASADILREPEVSRRRR